MFENSYFAWNFDIMLWKIESRAQTNMSQSWAMYFIASRKLACLASCNQSELLNPSLSSKKRVCTNLDGYKCIVSRTRNISHAAYISKEGDFGDKLVMSMAKDVLSFSDVLDAIVMQYIHITTEASKCSYLLVSTHTISLHTYHHEIMACLRDLNTRH